MPPGLKQQEVPPECPMVDERREASFATLDLRLETLHRDVGDVKSVLRDLTQAITKLALIEERQGHTTQQVNRTFIVLEKLETRISSVEKKITRYDSTSIWMDRLIFGAAGVLLTFAAKQLGLL